MGGRKIETREISSAKTTPRTVSSGGAGKSGHVAIVAPAGDLKATRSSRQKHRQPKAQPQQVLEKARPAGEEKNKDHNKEQKKDRPGKEEPHG